MLLCEGVISCIRVREFVGVRGRVIVKGCLSSHNSYLIDYVH